MKIILAPSDLGGGLGHVSRCDALARISKDQGHSVAFILENPKIIKLINQRYRVLQIQAQNNEKHSLFRYFYGLIGKFQKPPLYIKITDLSYQVLRDGLVDRDSIIKKISDYIEILKKEKPDVIIGDTNLIIGTAARVLGIPIVQLVRKGFHPNDPELIWWQTSTAGIDPPPVTDLFNSVLNYFNLESIQKTEDLLTGDLYLIPSLPELEPLSNADKTFYIGPLINDSYINDQSNSFRRTSNPLVYITIGAGAGTVGSKEFYKTVISAFAKKDIDVVVSTTDKYFSEKLNHLASNIRIYPWVNSREILSQADVLIFHGGYGTMMESLTAAVPSIVIPFHTEQESNGRRLKQQKCSEILNLSDEEEKIATRKWADTTYSYAYKTKYDLKPSQLESTVEKMLDEPSYGKAVTRLQANCNRYETSKIFFDLLNLQLGVI